MRQKNKKSFIKNPGPVLEIGAIFGAAFLSRSLKKDSLT